MLRAEMCDRIGECVGPAFHALHWSVRLLGTRDREALIVADLIPHTGRLPAFRKPGGDWSENLPPMKGLAHRLKVVMFDTRIAHNQALLLAFRNKPKPAIVCRYTLLLHR